MSPCIKWHGPVDRNGYGRRHYEGRIQFAHRVTWFERRGPIPTGMTVDHICWNPLCINIEHLQLLTLSENAHRQRSAFKRHCKNGHEMTEMNTYLRTANQSGRRQCRRCNADAARRYKARKKTAA